MSVRSTDKSSKGIGNYKILDGHFTSFYDTSRTGGGTNPPPPEGYQIQRSVRFNSADSAYLNRTPASAGNRKTWTWAGWVKRGLLNNNTTYQILFSAGTGNPPRDVFFFDTDVDDTLAFYSFGGLYGASTLAFRTNAVFRDPSAWYHIVLVLDTPNATSTDRLRLYVNGLRQTFSTYVAPTQNADSLLNSSTDHAIGRDEGQNVQYLDGYLADIHFIDGQALDPTSFGEFDDNGIWQPIEYTGSFGTNGFHLSFSDNSTAASLGTDSAGSNNWTVNNISVAAGAGNDSLVDSPTNGTQTDTGLGGEVVGNYCTWNPLHVDTSNNLPPTFRNGNLDVAWRTGDWNVAMGTIRVSTGKWYWEMTLTAGNRCMIGISKYTTFNSANAFYYSPDVYVYFSSAGTKWNNNTQTAYGATFAQGDVIGVALDMDAGTIVFYKNGVSQGTAFSSLSGNFAPVWGTDTTGNTHTANFGSRPFAYTAPSGFKALNTASLPAPTIENGSAYMDVKLYTGTGSTQTISGLEFSPDLVWVKNRTAGWSHALSDTVRGSSLTLFSDATAAEQTRADCIVAFNTDGFDVGPNDGTGTRVTNAYSDAYVAWTWDAGSSTVTNTDGSITSSVRANATAGCSIVTYSGTLATATVGHGLGVAPGMIIFKQRGSSVQDWRVYHSSVGASKSARLNTTAAFATQTTDFTAVSSTTFTLGVSSATNEGNMLAYCFAPVESYSAFGSYTGNGSTDGPFVFCGFRPRWLLVKRSSSTGNWTIKDTSRPGYNVTNLNLFSNLSNAETTEYPVDLLSNGFKVREGTFADWNASGSTYIYAAFAESPFAANNRGR